MPVFSTFMSPVDSVMSVPQTPSIEFANQDKRRPPRWSERSKCKLSVKLLERDIGLLDHLAPDFDFVFDQGIQFIGRTTHWIDPHFLHGHLNLGEL